jgi:hypothetical protein
VHGLLSKEYIIKYIYNVIVKPNVLLGIGAGSHGFTHRAAQLADMRCLT